MIPTDQSETPEAKVKATTRRELRAKSITPLRSRRFALAATILTRAALNWKNAQRALMPPKHIDMAMIFVAADEIYGDKEHYDGIDAGRESCQIARMICIASTPAKTARSADQYPALSYDDVLDAVKIVQGMAETAEWRERNRQLKAYAKKEADEFCDMLRSLLKPDTSVLTDDTLRLMGRPDVVAA